MKALKIILITCGVFTICIVCEILFWTKLYPSFSPFLFPPKIVEERIDEKCDTAKELSELGLQMISKYGYDKKSESGWTVGNIFMSLNEKGRGRVTITYVKASKDSPSVIFVDFDTTCSAFKRLSYYRSGKGVSPHFFDFSEWIIDSDEAIEIAKKELEKDFVIDGIVVFVKENDGRGIWGVGFNGKKDNSNVWVEINPYTGEIIE